MQSLLLKNKCKNLSLNENSCLFYCTLVYYLFIIINYLYDVVTDMHILFFINYNWWNVIFNIWKIMKSIPTKNSIVNRYFTENESHQHTLKDKNPEGLTFLNHKIRCNKKSNTTQCKVFFIQKLLVQNNFCDEKSFMSSSFLWHLP